jgi:glycosyltransferase involved in cell wall biosynthesis
MVRSNPAPDPGPPPESEGHGFLFASRLHVEKGYELLLSAWRLSGLGSQTHLTIAGDGTGRAAVEEEAARSPSVRYLGAVDGGRGVSDLVRQARAVVVPSLWEEPFGITVIEAFASGRPVVGTAVGAIQHLVDDEVGWLAEPRVESLAAALNAAMGPDAAIKGRAARRRYEANYSPGRAAARLLEVYQSAVDAGMEARRAAARGVTG